MEDKKSKDSKMSRWIWGVVEDKTDEAKMVKQKKKKQNKEKTQKERKRKSLGN